MAEGNNRDMGRDRDLVLAPGEFSYVLDTTKGLVNTIVGPNKISMSNTDQPVVWDKKLRRFQRVEADKAIQINTIAPEGFYVVLYNPAESHPRSGVQETTAKLTVGHRVNMPGPVHFALWPGQMATVIQGHHLRSNQYLLAQVYNDAEATANWKNAVLKPALPPAPIVPTGETPPADAPPVVPASALPVEPRSFSPGQLIVIKGTEVAFFIPPTGIKVIPERFEDGRESFVREAVTLERLEYCILLDEDGNKRFVQGPDVVFPEPTETFVTKDGQRKFRAIELNETTGIYVKVIADYEDTDKDGNTVRHKQGDELFITGKEQAIYFQREEHSVIRYGDQTKHYAVAVPAGEGRYVLNRLTGNVALVRGPIMLLCDPRTEVIILRAISEQSARLWFPGNEHVVALNKARYATTAPPTEPSQYEAGRPATAGLRGSALAALNYSEELASAKSRQIAGDTFSRGTTFTPPRTITLDTKYDGAIAISVWTGYAVLIINKTGKRRVVTGPENILLEYDETLAPLELSTGKPKSDGKLFRTVYLRVHNNKVTDIVRIETQDLVPVELTISYRVNFEGEPEKWFEVENYVQLLSDHMRSLIRNAAKRVGIETFYANTIDIIRDAVLGKSDGNARPGRTFSENGMRVYDAEILDIKIDNPNVASLLGTAQMAALKGAIGIAEEERELALTLRSEDIKRQMADAKVETAERLTISGKREIDAMVDLNMAKIMAQARQEEERLANRLKEQTAAGLIVDAEIAQNKALDDARLSVREAEIELELKRILGETEEIVKRAQAVDANLAIALTTMADQALIERISTTLAPMAAMNGVSAADILGQLFHGTPFESVMKQLGSRTRMPGGGTIEVKTQA